MGGSYADEILSDEALERLAASRPSKEMKLRLTPPQKVAPVTLGDVLGPDGTREAIDEARELEATTQGLQRSKARSWRRSRRLLK